MVRIDPRLFSFFDPWSEAARIPNVVDAMMRDFRAPGWPSNEGIPVNVRCSDASLLVELVVPGYRAENVQVALEADRLLVRGERYELGAGEGEQRLAARFERSFRLPFRPDAERVQAAMTDGVLEVRVPRAESDMPRRIPVTQS